MVPNWSRCQIGTGAKLTLLHSWCQIGSGAKLTLLNSWCQIGSVPNWLRCQIGTGAKLVPVLNCPPIVPKSIPWKKYWGKYDILNLQLHVANFNWSVTYLNTFNILNLTFPTFPLSNFPFLLKKANITLSFVDGSPLLWCCARTESWFTFATPSKEKLISSTCENKKRNWAKFWQDS